MMDTDFERIADKIKGLSQDDIKKIWSTLDKQKDASFALGIWARFKAIHPNTPENPDYSEASVKRWLYHINEAEKNAGFEKVELDMREIEKIREENRKYYFEDFDENQQAAYLAIAECFPCVAVFACGSQVRGDNMRIYDFGETKDARRKAGMRVDRNSDFDFWVHPIVEHNSKQLPDWADRYRGKFNKKEMIPIPIYYGDV